MCTQHLCQPSKVKLGKQEIEPKHQLSELIKCDSLRKQNAYLRGLGHKLKYSLMTKMVNSAISITIHFQDWKIIKGFHYKILHTKRNTKCKELLQIIVWKTSMLNHTRQLSQTSRAVFRLNLPKLSPKLYFKLLLKNTPSGYRMFILLYQVTNKHDAFPECLPVERW